MDRISDNKAMLQTLLDISIGLYDSKTFEDIGNTVANNLHKFRHGHSIGGVKLGIYDAETDEYWICFDLSRKHIMEYARKISQPLNKPVTLSEIQFYSKRAIDIKQSLIIQDNHSEFSLSIDERQINLPEQSMIFIPLFHNNVLVGLLSFARSPKNSMDNEFVVFLESIAKFVSISIYNLLITNKRKAELEELKISQRSLRESEEMYRSLIDTSPDGITISALDGKIIGYNQIIESMQGVKNPEDFIGHYWIEFIITEEHERAYLNIKRIMEEKVLRNIEHTFIRQDKSKFTGELSASLVGDAEGNPKYIIGIVRDITDRKKTESERFRLQNLESLGLLAGGIAHDFNNILSVILGRVSLSLISDSEEMRKNHLSSIEKAAKRAIGLTNQLMTFAKGGAPEKCLIDLKKIIRDTAKFCLSGSSVEPEFILKDSYCLIADPGHIAQIIQNLVINSKQAMPQGGKIIISTENYHDELNNFMVKIQVKDFGTGISKDHIDRIFDPYFTTKQSGSGLGLSVVHSIINRHDGQIYVESEDGKGATFTIYLPATKNQSQSGIIQDIEFNEKLKILIMDDEEEVRDVLSQLLNSLGHLVTVSKDGSEAIQTYKKEFESKKPFDLVFMDLTIKGGMGGIEAMNILKDFDPKIKSVVSSGYSDQSLADFNKYGFIAKLKKPYTVSELNNVIFEVFNK